MRNRFVSIRKCLVIYARVPVLKSVSGNDRFLICIIGGIGVVSVLRTLENIRWVGLFLGYILSSVCPYILLSKA